MRNVGEHLKSIIQSFRVRELNICLLRLGLPVSGVKSSLVDRLFQYVEQELRLGRLRPDSPAYLVLLKTSEEMRGAKQQERLSRNRQEIPSGPLTNCFCKNIRRIANDTRIIKCVEPNCGMLEHVYCLFSAPRIPEWSTSGHRCIRCRMRYADPFWRSVRPDILSPTPLREVPNNVYNGNQLPNCMAELRYFDLTHSDLAQIQSGSVKLQVNCLQLDDSVQFRFHWPINCKLIVNGKEFRVYLRHADNKITDGQRDEPADISTLALAGKNSIELTCQDRHHYIFAVQIVSPVPVEKVKELMHKPEYPEASVMRVQRIVRSQLTNDMDDEVQTMTSTMPLKCPFSFRRIVTPARLLNVDSLECVFDMDAFLSMAKKTRKWACPHSLKQSSVHHLAKDVWLEAVLKCLQKFPEVQEIEVSKTGMWRLRGEIRWRSVYNTIVVDKLPTCYEETSSKLKTDVASDDETEDEEEELRKAAMAAKQAFKTHYQNNPRSENLEVVDLVTSEEDEEVHSVQPVPTHYPSNTKMRVVPLVDPASRLVQGGRGHFPTRSVYEPQPYHHPRAIQRAHVGFPEQIPFENTRVLCPTYQRPPSALRMHCRPIRPLANPTPTVASFMPNYQMPAVHMPSRTADVFVNNAAIEIQPGAMPRTIKRQRDPTDRNASCRQMDKLNRRLTEGVVLEPPSTQMECIEIDMEDSE